MRVLVTGANGFVGRALCRKLSAGPGSFETRAAVRTPAAAGVIGWAGGAAPYGPPGQPGCEAVAVGSIGTATDWSGALREVDAVVHLAARVHAMSESRDALHALETYRSVNTAGTLGLARQAIDAGVRRFVYVSTIKVNGDISGVEPFDEACTPSPVGPYAVSKWEAEQALNQLAADSGLELVIIRPPLVYGPGVGGNFRSLLALIDRALPLPLASVGNRRSLISLANLVDALTACLTAPAASSSTYVVCDDECVSTAKLIRMLSQTLDRPARLFPAPAAGLRLMGRLLRQGDKLDRLTESLEIDGSKIRRDLGWRPPQTLSQGLEAAAIWYQLERPGL